MASAHGVVIVTVLLVLGITSPVISQQLETDSCSGNLTISHLIPFGTSSLYCLNAWNSQDFILRYENTSAEIWSFVLSAPDTGAYIAIGFSTDGKMVGSSAVAGWITPSGPGIAKQYYLGGEKPNECQPDNGVLKLVNNKTVIVSQASRLYLAFQINVGDPLPDRLIYAVGPRNNLPSPSNNLLSEHRTMTSTRIDYSNVKLVDGGDNSAFPSERQHGLLVLLGWGVLMPIGVMAARYFKHHDPQWFYSHFVIQATGFALGIAGIVLGFRLDANGIDNLDAHKGIGITILVCGALQAMAFLARPDKASKVRRYWNWYHHNVGRLAIAFSIANIFLGLTIASEATAWYIAYGVFLGVWLLLCAFLEIRNWTTQY